MTETERDKSPLGVTMRESGVLLREGWVHLRASSSWSKRWLQVCNERIFFYKSEKASELQGVIVLAGCNLVPRRRKASTPEDMLEISHPERRSIFARVGPQNERLSPWNSSAQHHVRSRCGVSIFSGINIFHSPSLTPCVRRSCFASRTRTRCATGWGR